MEKSDFNLFRECDMLRDEGTVEELRAEAIKFTAEPELYEILDEGGEPIPAFNIERDDPAERLYDVLIDAPGSPLWIQTVKASELAVRRVNESGIPALTFHRDGYVYEVLRVQPWSN